VVIFSFYFVIGEKFSSRMQLTQHTGYTDGVAIKKNAYTLPVMPDLIRHPVTQYYEEALDSGSSPE
jgi:hypothetical protein